MNTSCSICLEVINENDKCTLNCNHQFCKKCIDECLQKNNQTCPNCRAPIQCYHHNDTNYQLLCINPNDTNQINENRLLRNQLTIYQVANRKILQLGYVTLSAIAYLSYNYLYQYKSFHDQSELLQECYRNNSIIHDLLTDRSRSIVVYNKYDSYECDISEDTYNRCFHTPPHQ